MKFSIVTPKGKFFDGDVEYVVIDGDNGQLAILENHSPVVVGVNEGFIKRVLNEEEHYYIVSGGIVEYQNNVVNVIAQEIAEGATLEEAQKAFQDNRNKTDKENKRKLMDFTELERELAKNIKEIKASKL